ncbi:uncharacterized protein LOC144874081 [Branchiostoma floridae x Branchiostoma japonicum]
MRDSRPRGLMSSEEVCVPLEHQCNGFRDCSDGSDEEYCTDSCPLLFFNCKDSDVCIYFEYLCDTIFDCPDGSDENKCEKCEQYQCGGDAGSCFLDRDRCDGFVDCPDGLDVKNCTCPLGMLECKEGLPFPCIHDAVLSQCGMRDCPKATNNTAINCISAYSHVPGWNFRKCFTNEFECETSSICVPLSRVCDGRNDCGDLSDETCADPKSNPKSDWACMLGWFECESNMCVPADSVCDGVDDCDDASDESRCACTSAEFQCENSLRCVKPSQVCDGNNDCDDATDELLCKSCSYKGWDCGNGECIDPNTVCDGDNDCSSGADEENCKICDDDQFYCADGTCLSLALHCDSKHDCSGGEDEERCAGICNSLQLECDDRCLPKYRACDGLHDCSNGRDEKNCTSQGCGVKQFLCSDGTCLFESQLCNSQHDCSGGEDEDDCGEVPPPGYPLGLGSRYIPDAFITASSEYKSDFASFQARPSLLHTAGYCWVPSSLDDQWLQVYFGRTTKVTGVVISGGGTNWDLGSWVTSFNLAFSMDGTTWVPYERRNGSVQVFQGNRDRYNKVSRPFPDPVTSRYTRLYPTAYEGWIAVAMEVYVTNDENTWLSQEGYVPLGVGIDPDDPGADPKVPAYALHASSRVNDSFPRLARLNNGEGWQRGACWSPVPDLDTDPWLQIQHDRPYIVVGVITQGAYNLDHWVTAYKLAFRVRLDVPTWAIYTNSEDEEMVRSIDYHCMQKGYY